MKIIVSIFSKKQLKNDEKTRISKHLRCENYHDHFLFYFFEGVTETQKDIKRSCPTYMTVFKLSNGLIIKESK